MLRLGLVVGLLACSSVHCLEFPTSQQLVPSTRLTKEYDAALEAVFSVAIRLQGLMDDSSEKNFLVSPLSIAVTVGELMAASKGALRAHLHDFLVLNSSRVVEGSEARLHQQLGRLFKALQRQGEAGKSYTLKTAGALFLLPGVVLEQPFRDLLLDTYDADVREVDFAGEPLKARQAVNRWAAEQTNGLVKTILPPGEEPLVAVLANAVYFRGEWETPFSAEISRIGAFHSSANSSVQVTFMRGQLDLRYAESPQLACKMIVLPYLNSELAMYLVLPNADGGKEFDIGAFARRLKPSQLLDLINSTYMYSVSTVIPKMALSNSLSIAKPLKKYVSYRQQLEQRSLDESLDGLDQRVDQFAAFHDRRPDQSVRLDFSAASRDPRFTVSEIFQQMTLSVNEKGTEAAAVAAGFIEYSGDTKVFRANRPFMFFIRHEESSAILFWGTIVDPTRSN